MNDKYIQNLIDAIIAQRNEALNQVAQLQSQLKIANDELSLTKEANVSVVSDKEDIVS